VAALCRLIRLGLIAERYYQLVRDSVRKYDSRALILGEWTSTTIPDWFAGLRWRRELAGDAGGRPVLVYGGARRQKRQDADVVPWSQIDRLAAAV